MMVRTSTEHVLLKALKELTEAELTQGYLIPLFDAMGFTGIDYHGGPHEQGKDVIMWETNKLGRQLLVAVQVKKLQLSASASKKQSFAGLITQLHQALLEPVPRSDGQQLLASSVWFVTPFALETRSLKSHFGGLLHARAQQIEIVDGRKLLALLEQYRPDLLTRLGGHQYAMRHSIDIQAHNKALLDALELSDAKDLTTIYCDVFFGIAVKKRAPVAIDAPSPDEPLELSATEWKSLLAVDKALKNLIAVGIVLDSQRAVEERFGRATVAHQQSRIMRSACFAVIEEIKRRVLVQTGPENDRSARLRTFLVNLRPASITEQPSAEEENFRRLLRDDDRSRISAKLKTEASNAITEIDGIRGTLGVPEPAYAPKLVSSGIAAFLKVSSDYIKGAVKKLHRSDSSSGLLRNILARCDQVAQCIRILQRDPLSASVLKTPQALELLQGFENMQLSIPLHRAFETGLDMTVLGDAGAGKTTNLQVYAKRASNRDDRQPLILFAPLPALVRHMAHAPDQIPQLEGAIAHYLAELGCPISESNLIRALETSATVALLDSIDEAIPASPRIIEAMERFRSRYPRLQIVTTSRVSGAFAERAPFLQLTLLPFSPEQRDTFISNWFEDNDKDARLVQAHLAKNKELAEVVRNPLAATILCVLQAHKVDLPMTESNLYKHRFELLTGLFDRYKGVKRLHSRGETLETVAKALAYEFHRRKLREAEKTEARGWALERLQHVLQEKDIVLAVDELVHPCDVLIPTSTGRLDFGHLRFQEYLVARELAENRQIPIDSLLGDPWWNDTFVLYAQIAKEMEWLLDRASAQGLLGRSRRTLEAMFSVRREPERSVLLTKLASRAVLEREEGPLAFDDLKEQGDSALYYAEARYEQLNKIELMQEKLADLNSEIAVLDATIRDTGEILHGHPTSEISGRSRRAKRGTPLSVDRSELKKQRARKSREHAALERQVATAKRAILSTTD